MALSLSTARTGCARSAALIVLLAGVLAYAPGTAYAQAQLWRAYTSLREVTSLDATDEVIWVGTTGGVYSFTIGSGEIRRYTIAEGLHGISVQAIAFDAGCGEAGCVWIGYGDGVLDCLDVGSGTVNTYRDIERATRYADRAINRIVLHGDSAFVATAFGLVVFDTEKREVRDTYDQIGSVQPASPVRDAVVAPAPSSGPALWLATTQGVAYAPFSAGNLKDPASWTVETSGLPSLDARSVEYFDGSIFVGTATDLSRRVPDGTYGRIGVTGEPVNNLAATDEIMVGTDRFGIIVMDDTGRASRFATPGYIAPAAIDVVTGRNVWFGDRDEGLISARIDVQDGLSLTDIRDCSETAGFCYPEGPYHNQFRELQVDAAGTLWAAGEAIAGGGFYSMDPEGQWTDYIGRRVEALRNRAAFTTIYVQDDGTAWSGSEGFGLARVNPDGEVIVYDRTNSTLRTVEGETNLDYINVGRAGSDEEGNVWVPNRGAARPLSVRTPDGEWTSLPFAAACSGISSVRGTYRDLFVDAFGHKWISVIEKNDLQRYIGLLVLDTRGTPTDPSDDECRLFTKSDERGQGLPGNEIHAVVEDRDGFIWVATDEGIVYILNNGIVASDPGAIFNWPLYADRERGTYLFHGLKINDIAVDPANRLWVATDVGVWLVQQAEGGYEELLHFTTENSPLLADNVNDVEVNPLTGEVFFSTVQGLISYRGDAVMPVDAPRELFVYPNPVRVQETGDPVVYIDGLVEATEILIMSPDGSVISRFEARGGRARWDGRDSRSQRVPSGVYLVVAIGQNGEGTAYGKVAVIR